LKVLEERGLATREIVEERPPRVNYSLTGKGEKVMDLLKQLIETV
jgi:DNA-binding HxlR family transcriptional regulator